VIPSLAQAQSLAGTIRDASGAVLPGVTVEAASPALIEKVRTTVSDGTGQYRMQYADGMKDRSLYRVRLTQSN